MCSDAASWPAAYQCKAAASRGATVAACAGAAGAAAPPATPALQCCAPTAQHCHVVRRTAIRKQSCLPCCSESEAACSSCRCHHCIASAVHRGAALTASAEGSFTSTRSVPPFCREPAIAGDTPTSRAPATSAACDQPCSLCSTEPYDLAHR